jgi:hypothetical protein
MPFFDSVSISTYNRIAQQGPIEIEFGPGITKTYTISLQTLWSYSSSASSVAADFTNGVPNTFDSEGDFDVEVRDQDVTDAIDFSDIDSCYYAGFLSVTNQKKPATCLDQSSDVELGMCDRDDIPDATVDIGTGIAKGSASGLMFSLLSVFIAASLFILF